MTKNHQTWHLEEGDGPIMAAAIHDGHAVRAELVAQFALSDADRLREEDPHTGRLALVAATRLIAGRSRFEVDLNRPRDMAVYLTPADAWGLEVWKSPISQECLERSLAVYDAFYEQARELLQRMVRRWRRVVMLDLHSYNHRRAGPGQPPADPEQNPEVNLGTGTMNREYWSTVVERFMADLHSFDYLGRRLDVRENVKFRGGNFPEWIHKTFPDSVCVLSVEWKKFFMDEWTGRADKTNLEAIRCAMESTLPGLREELAKLGMKEQGTSA